VSDSDVEPAAAREADGDRNRGRYRTMEYDGEDGVVTIFQDVENDRAWVQSDTTIPVER
jgi:hypothetical protein